MTVIELISALQQHNPAAEVRCWAINTATQKAMDDPDTVAELINVQPWEPGYFAADDDGNEAAVFLTVSVWP